MSGVRRAHRVEAMPVFAADANAAVPGVGTRHRLAIQDQAERDSEGRVVCHLSGGSKVETEWSATDQRVDGVKEVLVPSRQIRPAASFAGSNLHSQPGLRGEVNARLG